jgi:anti-sigma28 factor (negative regulator of flagellin synthesis)
MRIDESNLNDSVSSVASRAAESQRIQAGTAVSSGAANAGGGDRVDLSGLAGRISESMQALASQSAQRVSQLRSDFRAGSYQPDAAQLSRALMGA